MIKQTIFIGALFSLCSISNVSAMQGQENKVFNALSKALLDVEYPIDVQEKLDEYWERNIVHGVADTKTKLANNALILGNAKAAVLCNKELVKRSMNHSAIGNLPTLKLGYAQALANLSLTEQKLKNNNS